MFASGLVGYLFGSIPVAYFLVRKKTGKDLRSEGSGNVGSLNSYVVTKSWGIGVTVLVLDVLKGLVPVVLVSELASGFIYLAAAGIGAVLGHNFPVWLKFKGGRGLATALGVLLMISWPLAVVWAVGWSLAYLVLRHINMANAIATVVALVVVLGLPADTLRKGIPDGASVVHFRYFTVLLAGLILIKLLDTMTEYFKARRGGNGQQGESGNAGS